MYKQIVYSVTENIESGNTYRTSVISLTVDREFLGSSIVNNNNVLDDMKYIEEIIKDTDRFTPCTNDSDLLDEPEWKELFMFPFDIHEGSYNVVCPYILNGVNGCFATNTDVTKCVVEVLRNSDIQFEGIN